MKIMENREIKFRIFDKKYKEYCEEPDFRWTLSRQGKLYNSEEDEWYDIGERFIVEFFTGLKDSKRTKEYPNGQDIYEGDVLNSNYFKNAQVVFWRNGWHLRTGRDTHYSFNTSMHSFEIIDKIYENPELL